MNTVFVGDVKHGEVARVAAAVVDGWVAVTRAESTMKPRP